MKIIAEKLLSIGAVVINNKEKFTWASGIKSPIYTDNRLITSFPQEREIIENALAKKIVEVFPSVNMLIGTATAGISHAAYVSWILNMPMGYVRASKKDHGKQNQIEGHIAKGVNVVVVEDLLSTGRSSYEVVNILKESGVNVLGVAAIFSYDLKVLKTNMIDTKFFSLTNLDELLNVAAERKFIDVEDIELVKDFREKL